MPPGNVGVNVAAGDNNQQANAAALASADASFVFGTATASTSVLQSGYGNALNNYSNPNTASLSNSANNVSGNLGVNVAAGNFNQQKNDLAAAVSNGQYSTAGSAASQASTGNTTVNSANYAYGGTYVSLKLNADGSYKGTSDQIGDVYLDTWEGQTHPGGSNTGHIDVDSQAQGAKDLNHDGGAFAFKEKGDVDLKGTVSGFIPAIVGFKTPVTNNASLSNSLQNVSGNVGVNIAAGGGNQQEQLLVHRRRLQQLPGRWREPWLLILAQGFRRQPEPFSIRHRNRPCARSSFPCCCSSTSPPRRRPSAFPPLPGGGLVYKQVQSIRERRFADLVEQKTDFSCGAAALATIPEKASRRPARRAGGDPGMLAHADPEIVRTQGFSMLDMKRYVESMGMRARGYRIEAAQLEQLKIPAIVLMEIRGYKHFVVLQRTQGEYVYVGDPALGAQTLRADRVRQGLERHRLRRDRPGIRPRQSAADAARAADRAQSPGPLQTGQGRRTDGIRLHPERFLLIAGAGCSGSTPCTRTTASSSPAAWALRCPPPPATSSPPPN